MSIGFVGLAQLFGVELARSLTTRSGGKAWFKDSRAWLFSPNKL
ncbi:hypothetical protein VB712_09290 [Spirulina sp. CCNP1310]|nr:hypothetical protein [Spirulina sp. CCNP1310]MEA5419420.1 hypothetical protein [Spirulina sp. CCNP1310]